MVCTEWEWPSSLVKTWQPVHWLLSVRPSRAPVKPAPSEPAGAKAGKVGKRSKKKQEWSVSCLWDSALLYAVFSKVLCVCVGCAL